ncbi:MAG: transposase [Massilia sp.]|jgi:transposase|nr:transposase [Massilia sp.]
MDQTNPPTIKVPGKRKSFTSKFKKEAVAKLETSTNVSLLAVELGIRRNQLYKWQKQLQASGPDATMKSPGRPPAKAESEVTRLRRDNARLEMELAILKKAEAYFRR